MKRYEILVYMFSFLIFFTTVTFSSGVCTTDIYSPNKYDIRVKYRNTHWYYGDWKKGFMDAGCRHSGGVKYWKVPKTAGKTCNRRSYEPDGCSLGKGTWTFTARDKKIMTPACNEHDLCYSTLGRSKHVCDVQFYTNLSHARSKFKGTYSAEAVYVAVKNFGENAYKNGQKWAKKNDCK